ncbi:MAG TPA: STAS domain-containing protein [Pseudonocardiaceae bacterium]|jgi:anti-anti-sigma factor
MNSVFPADIVGLHVAEHSPDMRVITVTGEVDALTAQQLLDCLITHLTAARVVVVNLDGVRYLASSGLRALFEANEFATHQGHHLRLVSKSRTANLVLETTGLREHFTFADTVPEALNDVPGATPEPS